MKLRVILNRIINETVRSGITYQLHSNVIYAYDKNNNKIGHLKSVRVANEPAFLIDYVEVTPSYRNLGIYKELVRQTFKLRNTETLYSVDRVPFTNELYRKWTGNVNLQRYDKVKISLVNNDLIFKVL